jgi:hypothetical protein
MEKSLIPLGLTFLIFKLTDLQETFFKDSLYSKSITYNKFIRI